MLQIRSHVFVSDCGYEVPGSKDYHRKLYRVKYQRVNREKLIYLRLILYVIYPPEHNLDDYVKNHLFEELQAEPVKINLNPLSLLALVFKLPHLEL